MMTEAAAATTSTTTVDRRDATRSPSSVSTSDRCENDPLRPQRDEVWESPSPERTIQLDPSNQTKKNKNDDKNNNDNNNDDNNNNNNDKNDDKNDNNMNHHGRVMETASPASSLPLSMRLLQFAPCANCQHCRRRRGGGRGDDRDDRYGSFALPWEEEEQSPLLPPPPPPSFQPPVDSNRTNPHGGNQNHAFAFTNLANIMMTSSNNNSNSNNNNNNTFAENGHDDSDNDDDIHSVVLANYDIPALHRPNDSATSPLVAAPMQMTLTADALSKSHAIVMERILHEYRQACHFYGCGHRVNAGVFTTLRFSLPCLRVSGSFHDADMLALAEILLRYGNGPLRYIHRLDFTIGSKEGKLHGRRGFRSHGALTLAKVLQKSDYITQVLVQRHRIGPFGASAIFMACANNTTIRHLGLRRCCVGERGAFALAELIAAPPNRANHCGLTHVDLSANYIGFRGSMAIEQALAARWKQRPELPTLVVDLEGNLVFQEVMNGVTHGLGVLLAFVGSYLLHQRVQGLTPRHTVSCMVYSTSLIVLYVSSTLYHSFFTMQNTKYIFEVMDKCAIYVLIAGSYTPFLRIALWHEPLWSVYLLAFIWICSVLGITVEAFFPTWKHRNLFSLAMYLGMGWSAMICLPEVGRLLPESAMNFMILGGISYTVGVPFFVRNNNLDHAIWHLFVLGGSFFHWCGIYFHVATFAINET